MRETVAHDRCDARKAKDDFDALSRGSFAKAARTSLSRAARIFGRAMANERVISAADRGFAFAASRASSCSSASASSISCSSAGNAVASVRATNASASRVSNPGGPKWRGKAPKLDLRQYHRSPLAMAGEALRHGSDLVARRRTIGGAPLRCERTRNLRRNLRCEIVDAGPPAGSG
jgi:hypothetical protein